ncbi:comF family protein [Mariprofundus ferrinatatus]|uniref:ComF family protein n=2 Tax=Mariprofundus ferrinatatus TaxID=1921087 RepID=A0A2K8L0Q7_9PROT|nr:comF family protein [Mariprofundus ferrinatatus]
MVNGVQRLLFPPTCLFCQQLLDTPSLSTGCCRDCFEKIAVWPRSTCMRCGTELPEVMAPGPCGHCLNHPPAQIESRSLFAYRGPVRDAILGWKLQGQDGAVRWLLESAIPGLKEIISEQDLLVPVPMPLSRMRKSGSHHAADLCRWMAGGAGCRWDWQLLRRVGEQPRQSSLSGQARRRNLRKAFSLSDDFRARRGEASVVWVVDDIMTTGSTLHFAARAIKPVGCEVKVLSLARTLNRG